MKTTINNVPIPCKPCGILVRGTEQVINRDKQLVTECTWRCYRCGGFLKKGITKIHPKKDDK